MKKTLEQIEEALFILECKDHWNPKDWDEYHELESERKAFYPQPKEATKEEQDRETIKHYESLGMKFVGYNEKGGMEFVCTWEQPQVQRERKNIKKGHYNFF